MSARTDEDRETIVPDEKVSAILKTEDVSDTIEWYTGGRLPPSRGLPRDR
jgi:hypothetical protein